MTLFIVKHSRLKMIRPLIFLIVFSLFTSIIFGCKTSTTGSKPDPDIEAVVSEKPEELRVAYTRLYTEGERNEVLNLMRIGLDAIQLGHLQTANGAFNTAIQGIERVYADSDQAREARSLWNQEGNKIFKGEPYERAMAYYYSGLIYYWLGDVNNARARFQGGILQDQFAEEEQFRCDVALLYYLSGWCSQIIGGGQSFEKQQFDLLHQFQPNIKLPDPEDNVLLLFESGKSPRKLSDGVGHYQLKFFRGRDFNDKLVKFSIDDGPVTQAFPIEDVYFQAASRGGRQFDHILNGKAEFKKETNTAGSALADIGTYSIFASTVTESALGEVGAGLGLVATVMSIASARTLAEVDTRYWDNLPDTIHVYSLNLSPGSHELSISYFDLDENEILSLKKNLTLTVPENKRLLHWSRSRQQITNKQM